MTRPKIFPSRLSWPGKLQRFGSTPGHCLALPEIVPLRASQKVGFSLEVEPADHTAPDGLIDELLGRSLRMASDYVLCYPGPTQATAASVAGGSKFAEQAHGLPLLSEGDAALISS